MKFGTAVAVVTALAALIFACSGISPKKFRKARKNMKTDRLANNMTMHEYMTLKYPHWNVTSDQLLQEQAQPPLPAANATQVQTDTMNGMTEAAGTQDSPVISSSELNEADGGAQGALLEAGKEEEKETRQAHTTTRHPIYVYDVRHARQPPGREVVARPRFSSKFPLKTLAAAVILGSFLLPQPQPTPADIFKSHDIDANGKISLDELTQAFGSKSSPLAKKLFRGYDTDGDPGLSFTEFDVPKFVEVFKENMVEHVATKSMSLTFEGMVEDDGPIVKGTYTGEMKGGMPNGKGRFACDEFVYDGQWQNNLPHGKGSWQSQKDGQGMVASYDGEFENVLALRVPCKGTVISSAPCYVISIQGLPWMDGWGTFTFDSGLRYEGKFKSQKLTKGKKTGANGDIYEGEFEGEDMVGKFHGKGKITYADGGGYEGEFKHGKPNGVGTRTYPSGKIEKGVFKDGVHSGGMTKEDFDMWGPDDH